jgi:hypothetical protein
MNDPQASPERDATMGGGRVGPWDRPLPFSLQLPKGTVDRTWMERASMDNPRSMVGLIRRDGSRVRFELSGGQESTQPDLVVRDLGQVLIDPAVSLLIIEASRYAPPPSGSDLKRILSTVTDAAKRSGVRVEYRL